MCACGPYGLSNGVGFDETKGVGCGFVSPEWLKIVKEDGYVSCWLKVVVMYNF